MTAANNKLLLQQIRRLAGEDPSALADEELLRRYVATRDASAFALLVRRHGPMVYSVCQSVLRQRDDAEDAFQAAFLILAGRADSIRKPSALSCWLHGVAYRVAVKARVANARRQARLAQLPSAPLVPSVSEEMTWKELRAVLHDEIAALPERLRLPLILCYLEGLTQEEAARQLGWTAATVKGRMQRGRVKLRRRLQRRGVGLAAALGAALTGQTLAETAVHSSSLFTMASANKAAIALARGFSHPWLSMKLLALSVVLLTVGLVGGSIGLLSPKPVNEKPPIPADEKANDKAPATAAVDAHGDPLPDEAIARLGTVRFNHGDGLHSLFFAPDGKAIISEGEGSIRFWDAQSGKELDRIPTTKLYHLYPTLLLADGKTLITLSEGIDNRDVVSFWDLTEKKRIRTKDLPVRRQVTSSFHEDALSPDGKLCVLHVHTPAKAQVSDVTTGKKLYQLANGTKTFLAVAFAGNERLVSGDEQNRLEVWEARTGKLIRQLAHDEPIRFILAAPDGGSVATLVQRPSPFGREIKKDEVVHIWDLKSDKPTQSLPAKKDYWVSNIVFSPDGEHLLISTRSTKGRDEMTIWNWRTGKQVRQFQGPGIDGTIAVFSPDGRLVAEGSRAGKFELCDVKTGRRLTSEDSRHTQAAAVLLSPEGQTATILGWNSVSSWDAVTGRRLRSFDLPQDAIFKRGNSPDGRYALTFQTTADGYQMHVWDIHTGKRLHTLHAASSPLSVYSVASAFSPDATLLAIWQPETETRVHLWDLRSGKEIRSFKESKAGWPGKMFFSTDGKTLIVAGRYVVAYEIASGKELFAWRMKSLPNTTGVMTGTVGGPPEDPDDRLAWRSLDLSPDRTLIAAVLWGNNYGYQKQKDRLALYDARSGKLIRRWSDSGAPSNSFEQLVFSHDGQLLTSSDGEAVHVWEAATSNVIATFKGHQGLVNYLSFSEDDRRLASASSDSTVLIWDLTGQRKNTTKTRTEDSQEQLWKELASDDARRAHYAIWALTATPDKAVALLKDRLHPVKAVKRARLERLLKDLDSDQFTTREQAAAELEKLGALAEPSLRRILQNKPSLEQRRRIEPILNKIETRIPFGETLRSLRAVRVLEHAGTAEALRLLEELAKGAEGAALTRAALAAKDRWQHKAR
jgi:RNA polymerase sigma factor (sigma-70 family)